MNRAHVWPTLGPRLLSRLRVVEQKYQDLRVERILAFSRLFLSLTCLASWFIAPVRTDSQHRVGMVLLTGYAVSSLLLLLWVEAAKPGRLFTSWAQVNDLGWPALLCLFINVSDRPFYVLFLFAMIAAAFRWGFIETLGTALFSVALLPFQVFLATHGPANLRSIMAGATEPVRVVLRCVFLFVAGTLLGFLAETEKELRAEIALTNRLLSLARVGNRFSTVLHSVLTELARVFQGSAIVEVVAQSSTGRAFRWEMPTLSQPNIHAVEIAPADKASDLMAGYPHTFYMQRNGSAAAATLQRSTRKAAGWSPRRRRIWKCRCSAQIPYWWWVMRWAVTGRDGWSW